MRRLGIAYVLALVACGDDPTMPPTPKPPAAPHEVMAVAGNAQAMVAWAAPDDDGGSPILGYRVTSSVDGAASDAITTTATLTGLHNGTSYTFTVIAYNAAGDSEPSLASNAVTPATVPTAPLIGVATAGNAIATVHWTAPSDSGGSAITLYTVSANPGGASAQVGASATQADVTGLANGTSYTFMVVATNGIGTSPPSSPSNTVTPATVPDAPTIGTATAGNAQATVTWTAPGSDGGNAIISYTVTSYPGGITASAGAGAAQTTVTGLANGTSYTFTVTATNDIGTSAASAASNAITPATVPDAPTIGTATAGNAQATVTWTAPASDGGDAITSYTVTSNPGGLTATAGPSATQATVTGLANGTSYTFTVTAANTVGASAPSGASNPVTPATVPDAPTIGTATAGNMQATVTWSAPGNNGGSAITGYTVTSNPGGITASAGPSASQATVTGLTNGTTYTFTVTAANALGTSVPSVASNAVTPNVPASCKAVLTSNPSAPSGVYAIAPDGITQIQAYCDMTSSGGGWTLCFAYDTATYDAANWPDFPSSRNKLLAKTWGLSNLFGNGSTQGNFCNLMPVTAGGTSIKAEVVVVQDSSVLYSGVFTPSHANIFTTVHTAGQFDCLVDSTGTKRLMIANWSAPVGAAYDFQMLQNCTGAANIDTTSSFPVSSTFGSDGGLVMASDISGTNAANELGLLVDWYSDIPTLQLYTANMTTTQAKFGFSATWLPNSFGRNGQTKGPTQCYAGCGYTNMANNTLKQRLWVR